MPPATKFNLIVEDSLGRLVGEYSFDQASLFIGRSKDCQILLSGDNVSRRHARLYVVDNQLFVEDLDSSNGTTINGVPIERAAKVRVGDTLGVGGFSLRVRSGPPKESTRPALFTLQGLGQAAGNRRYQIVEKNTTMGRGPECDIVILDESISRLHARINVRTNGVAEIHDLGSANGVYVNDLKVKSWELSGGELIRLGNAQFRVEMPVPWAKATDEITKRTIEIKSSHSPVIIALSALIVLALLAIIGIIYWRVGPSTQVTPPVVPEVKATVNVTDMLDRAVLEFEAGRLHESDQIIAQVLELEPANEQAISLLARISDELNAQALLEAGTDAIEAKRYEQGVGFLAQIPASSQFWGKAQTKLAQLLPIVAAEEAAVCFGSSKRSIDCIKIRALQVRIQELLTPPKKN